MSVRAFTIANDPANPRAATNTTGASVAAIAGSISLARVTDSDWGTAYEVTLTGAGAAGVLTIDATESREGAINFARALVKQTSGPDSLASIRLGFFNSFGGSLETPRFVVLQKPTTLDEITTLEGFDQSTASGYFGILTLLQVYLGTVASTATFNVILQLDADAKADVPYYVDSETTDRLRVPTYGFSASGQFAISTSPLSADDTAIRHRQAGSRILRGGIPFSEYGTYDTPGDLPDLTTEIWDDWMTAIDRRGVKLLLTMGQPITWGGGNTLADLDPADYDELTAYWVAVIRQYRHRICAVEWYNEPNFDLFYGGTPDAGAYTDALSVLYPAIKAVAPEIPVLAGSMANIYTTTGPHVSIPDWLDGMYTADPTMPWDAISVHPYPVSARSGIVTGSSTYGFHGGLDAVRTAQAANGDDSPIWITEMGYERVTALNPRSEELTQGPVNALLRGMASRMDDVDGVILHTLDAPSSAFDHVLANGHMKPALQAVGT